MATLNNVIANANGSVGIGTSIPTQLLELKKTTGSSIALLNYNDSVKFNINASSGGAGYVGMVTNHDLIFVTNDTERARLNTNGNLGIGTTTVGNKLTVYTTTQYDGYYLKNANGVVGTMLGVSATNDDGTIGLYSNVVLKTSITANGVSYFNGGSVGIGTSSPAGKLELVGNFVINGASNSNIAQQVFTRSDVSWGIFNETDLRFYSSNSNTTSPSTLRMTITSTGNVGIGTSNPDIFSRSYNRILGISGSTAAIQINASSGNAAYFDMGVAGTRIGGLYTDSSGFEIGTPGAKPLYFYTNGSYKMTILSGGNVGIGTSNPSSKLHIVAAGTNDGIILDGSTNPLFIHRTSGTDRTYLATITNAGSFFTDASAYDFIIRSQTSNILLGRGSGASSMAIVGSYIGIGTTTTTSGLQIQTEGTNTTSGSFLFVRSTNSSFGGGAIGVGYDYAAAVGNNFTPFRIRAGSTNAIFVVNSAGVVYAGDTTGAVAYGNHDPYFAFNQDTNTGMDWAAADTLTFKTGGTERMRIQSDGNVGIGTTNPAQKFSVVGNIYLPQGNYITWNNGDCDIGGVSGYHLVFRTYTGVSMTEKVRIQSDGNVGIGTSSPAYKLDVSGTGRVGDVFLITTATTSDARLEIGSGRSGNGNSYLDLIGDATYTDYGLRLIRYDSGANSNSRLEHRGTGQLQMFTTDAAPFTISTNSTERMRLDNSGNVGIGTTTLSSLLTLNGTYPQIIANNPSTGSGVVIQLRDNGRDAGFMGHSTTTARLQFGSRGSTAAHMTISGDGDVGIGTTAPTNQANYRFLQVNSSVSSVIETMVAGSRIGGFDSTASTLYVGTIGSYPVVFRTAVVERMRIATDGKVGIGTSSPNHILDITGGTGTTINMGNSGDSLRGGKLTFISSSATGRQFYVGTNSSVYNLVFGIDSIEKARIDTAGNLGIGTTSPVTKLSVLGSPQTDNSFTYLMNLLNTDSTITAGMGAGISFGSNINSGGGTNIGHLSGIMGIKENATSGNYAGALTFWTRINGAASSEKLRIDSTGNVGIGTTTLTNGQVVIYNASGNTLSLQKFGGAAALIMGSETTNYALIESIVNGGMRFYTGNGTQTEKMRIEAGGNVGIGTSSPRVLLDLAKANNVGQVILIGETSTNIRTGFGLDSSTAGMRIFCPNLNSEAIYIGGISTSDGTTFTRNHSFGVGGKNSWLNEQGGNVGIGTTSPTALLHSYRNSNTTAPIGYFQEAYGSPAKTNVVLVERLNNLSNANVSASSAGVRIREHSNNYALSVEDHSGNSYLVVRGGGNIGIGTAIPTSRLNTYASGSNLSAFKVEGGNGTLFEVTDTLTGSLFSVNTIAGLPVLDVISNYRTNIYGPTAISASVNTNSNIGCYIVGMGSTTNAQHALNIIGYNQNGGTGYQGFMRVTNTYSTATNPNKYFRLGGTGTYEIVNSAYTAVILSVTDAGVLSTPGGGTSDIRTKNNIEYIDDSVLPIINQLKPASFEFKDNPYVKRHGFIAQDVLPVKPDLVLGDGYKEDGTYGLDYDGILALTVKALQEANAKIEQLEARISQLENK